VSILEESMSSLCVVSPLQCRQPATIAEVSSYFSWQLGGFGLVFFDMYLNSSVKVT
jgi:hypothetical protein